MIPVKKKSRARKIAIPKSFPSDTKQIVGYFTGNDVEVFDEDSIKTLNETCFGLNPKPRQMVRNQCSNVKKSTEADNNRMTELGGKFDDSITDSVESNADSEMTSGDNPVANPFPLPRSIVLFLEESFFLHHILGQLVVRDLDDKPMTTEELWQKFCKLKANFAECFISYLYLKSKCWVVKSGIKFGGDFLLYKQSPQLFHASFIVIVMRKRETSSQSYHTSERVAETTGKNLIYLEVYIPEDLDSAHYLECLEKFTVKEVCIQRHEMISK